ncbi:UNVERIFIED_CONTAM: hypothetical protein HDU68_007940 [Siphonaria sp. JEL0065]|nr:hypothetical protein HDU68_007940 [Siphonaria sp. JEL0065]
MAPVVAPVDACAALIAQTPINGVFLSTIPQVEACYNTFPVTQADKKDQIDAIKGYFNLYPYKDITKKSKTPYYPMSVDIFKTLDAITTSAAIKTERQLQTAIQNLLTKLEDGHIFYRPLCFQSYRYYQPFVLAPTFADDGPHYTVSQLTLAADHPVYQFWNKSFGGVNPSEFIGARINTINSQDPTEFLQDFVDSGNGIGHAPETRFNVLFPTYSWPTINDFWYYAFPIQRIPRPSTSYEFQFANGSITELKFEWPAVLKTSPTHFTSADQYYKTECTAPKSRDNKDVSQRNPHFEDPIREKIEDLPVVDPATVKLNGVPNPVFADANGAFFSLSDNKTGVWLHPTFHPQNGFSDYRKWLGNITNALVTLENNGVQRLIIDVTNNGGGFICAGWFLANYLFPKTNFLPLEYQSRMTQALANLIVADGDNNNFVWGKTLNGTFVTDYLNQAILPGEKIKGYPHLQSNRLLSVLDDFCLDVPGVVPLKKGWAPKDVLLVSNGVCGSTCAQFSTLLRNQVGVRVVTYGGGYKRSAGDNNFDPTAFAAGDILPFSAILEEFQAADPAIFTSPQNFTLSAQDPEDSILPRPFKFPINPAGQMPLLTSYTPMPAHQPIPIEWVIDPSEFFLENVNLGDPVSVWKGVLDNKFFESSKPSNHKV